MILEFQCFHEEEFKAYTMIEIAQNLELAALHYKCPACGREIIVKIKEIEK